jgi:Rho-binding antiterminator
MNNKRSYIPINCDVHDELESLATLRQECVILYHDSNHQEVIVKGRIEDVFSSEKEEYLRLSDGTIIRLDELIRINDKTLISSPNTKSHSNK